MGTSKYSMILYRFKKNSGGGFGVFRMPRPWAAEAAGIGNFALEDIVSNVPSPNSCETIGAMCRPIG